MIRHSLIDSVRPILATVRSVPVPAKLGQSEPTRAPAPFITVSRQPGAGAWTMAQPLMDSLNHAFPGEQPWSIWDRELVEKVAADHHLSEQLIESMENRSHSWFGDFLESLSFSDDPSQADEAKVYSRVARSIRALAAAGRVVIVGRGGVFITRRMPGGIHVRLVAPFEQRVAFMAREYHLTPDKAAARVKELERARQAFYKRYWPSEGMSPDTFALTINTAEVSHSAIIEMVTALVRNRVAAAGR